MRFGYTIVYVDAVPEVLDFYNRAFGFATRFLHESGDYGELDTGATVLAFASHEIGEMNLGRPYVRSDPESDPLGIELAFITDNVAGAFKKAVDAGASAVSEPDTKPWGQTVAYVRSTEGSLVELCTPIGT